MSNLQPAHPTSHGPGDPDVAARHHVAESPRVFGHLAEAHVNLAIWQRSVPEPMAALLRASASTIPAADERVLETARADVDSLFDGLPEPLSRWLISDVADLLEHFARV